MKPAAPRGRGSSQNSGIIPEFFQDSSCEQGTGVKRELLSPGFYTPGLEIKVSCKVLNTLRHFCAICTQGWAEDLPLSTLFYQILLRKQKICLFF